MRQHTAAPTCTARLCLHALTPPLPQMAPMSIRAVVSAFKDRIHTERDKAEFKALCDRHTVVRGGGTGGWAGRRAAGWVGACVGGWVDGWVGWWVGSPPSVQALAGHWPACAGSWGWVAKRWVCLPGRSPRQAVRRARLCANPLSPGWWCSWERAPARW